MGLYLYVAIWGSRVPNWIKFFYEFTHLDTVEDSALFQDRNFIVQANYRSRTPYSPTH